MLFFGQSFAISRNWYKTETQLLLAESAGYVTFRWWTGRWARWRRSERCTRWTGNSRRLRTCRSSGCCVVRATEVDLSSTSRAARTTTTRHSQTRRSPTDRDSKRVDAFWLLRRIRAETEHCRTDLPTNRHSHAIQVSDWLYGNLYSLQHGFTQKQGAIVLTVRTLFFRRRKYVIILPYVTSLYDENKLHASYLQPKFTKVSTECVTDSRIRKQQKRLAVLVTVTHKKFANSTKLAN